MSDCDRIEPGYCRCGCGKFLGLTKEGDFKTWAKGHWMKTIPQDELFWSKVDKRGPDDCWEWKGSTFAGSKYGQHKRRRKNWRAHRLAYTLAKGPIPDDKIVCHTCDNPPCCNPAHLWLGTHSENQLDCVSKGRNVPSVGESHGRSKLTTEQVSDIRATYPTMTQREIAAKFGVSQSQVHRIIRGKNWGKVSV